MHFIRIADILAIAARVSPFDDQPDHAALLRLLQRAAPTPDERERPVFDYVGVLFEGLVLGQWFADSSAVARHVAEEWLARNGIVIDPADPRLVEVATAVAQDRASCLRVAAVLRKAAEHP